MVRPLPITLVRDRLTWVTYAQLAVWCYFLYGFQPVVPLLRDEQGTSRTVAGLHGTAFAVGSILGGTIVPWATRTLGRQRLIWTGLTTVCLAAAGLWVSHPPPFTLGFAALASFGAACCVSGVVSALTDHHGPAGPASISEANAVGAAVGLIAPLAVGGAVTLGLGWRPGLAVVIVLTAGLAVVAWLSGVRTPEPKPVVTVPGRRHAPLPRAYWLAWVSIFATGSVEVCVNLWGADVLRVHAGVAPGVATAALSAMVAGLFVGRVVGGRLLLRYPATRVLLGALGLSAVGFAVFWVATVPWLAFTGLVICGLGVAMHYPLGIGLAVTHSAGQPDLAAARASYAVGISFGTAPFLLGAVADRVGPHLAFLVVPGFIALAAAVVFALERGAGRSGSEARGSAAAGDGDAVGERQHDRVDPLVTEHQLVEVRDGAGLGVVRRRIDDPTSP